MNEFCLKDLEEFMEDELHKNKMFQVGTKVKFLDRIWKDKKKLASTEGYCGPALDKKAKNSFTITSWSFGALTEYRLKEYPYLVWEEELEEIKYA
jgi:hypothetical protein